MPSAASLALAAGALLVLNGCAPTYSAATFRRMGEYDPRADEAVSHRYRELQEVPPARPAEVRVLLDTLPEGVAIDGNVVSVRPGYPLTILGHYDLQGPVGGPWSFPDYKSTGRKVYCYWQAPLSWVTLGLWALVVPVSYPCWTKDLTREEWASELRTLAIAAGGNLVVAHHQLGTGIILKADDAYLDRLGEAPASSAAPPVAPAAAGAQKL
ncbi:MAG: hypothetical protein JWP97_80 [Labilithrix sp.]|nr:hypothetical protein [Labilithrix sp.]